MRTSFLLAAATAAAVLGGAPARAGEGAPPSKEFTLVVPDLGKAGSLAFEGPGGLQGFVSRVGPGNVLTPAVEGRVVCAGAGIEMRGFDALDGSLLWTAKTDDSGPTSPAVRKKRVYFNTASCTLYSIDVDTGGRAWSHWIAGSVQSTVAIADDRVWVTGPAKEGGWKVECLDAASGKLLFTRALPADAVTAPVLSGDRAYLALGNGSVTALDRAGGATLWTKELGALAAPALHGGRLLVASGNPASPGLRDLDPATGDSSRAVPTPAPEQGPKVLFLLAGGKGPRGGAGPAAPRPDPGVKPSRPDAAAPGDDPRERDRRDGDPSDPGSNPGSGPGGVVVPSIGSFGYEGPRPCVAKDVVAMAAGTKLHLSPLGSGEARKPVDLPESAAGSAVAAGDLFLVATIGGRLLAFDPATGEGRFSIRFTAPDGKPVHLGSSPAVVRGRAYLGTTDGRLLGVDLPDPSADGWPMWGGGPGR